MKIKVFIKYFSLNYINYFCDIMKISRITAIDEIFIGYF